MLRLPQTLIELPKVHIKENSLLSIKTGAQVMIPALESITDVTKGERVSIYSGKEFVGVGVMQIDAKELQHKTKGIAIKMERVHTS
jgi:predicted RNA-binding protein (TIGR00451 family)